jgi:hypothetical protein
VQKVDSVSAYGNYDGRGDGGGDVTGVAMGDRRLTRKMTVTARPRGARVEVEIEATIAREGRDHAANAQVQNVATTLLVKEGEWVEVASGGAPEGSDPVKRQSTSARLEEAGLLLRVDRVRP